MRVPAYQRARPGVLFVSFHYGSWGTPGGNAPAPGTPGQASSELIATLWDPVSEQPQFKTAAAALLVERVVAPSPGLRPGVGGAVSPSWRPGR